MDQALKKRLIGAAVLFALLVIFVPMLFPGNNSDDDNSDVSLEIPAEPATKLDTRVFELDIPAKGSKPGEAASSPAQATTAVPATSGATAGDGSTQPAADAAMESRAPTADETAEAAAPTPANSAGTAAATRFAVSAGVFADADHAQEQLAKVALQGFRGHLVDVKVDGKPAQSVRVGPFDSRAEAEAARLRLRDGLDNATPALVALGGSASSDAPATAVADDAAAGWAVQVAAFREREAAAGLRDKIRAAGLEAFLDRTQDAKGTWWRVRVGPRTARADAEALKKQLQAKLDLKGLIVTHP